MSRQESLSAVYNGYRILISIAGMLLVLSGIFVYTIRIVLRVIIALILLALLLGLKGTVDQMKRKGLHRKQRSGIGIRILMLTASGILLVCAIPKPVKSILTGLILLEILQLVKPEEKRKEKGNNGYTNV